MLRKAWPNIRADTMHPSKKIYPVSPGEEKHNPFLGNYPRKLLLPVVYVIDMMGTPFCKIGSTSNIRSRVGMLQSASPFEVRCVYYLCPKSMHSHVRVEIQAQDILADKRHRGEWFDVPVEVAIDAIRGAL